MASSHLFKASVALFMLVMMCCSASGQLMVVGCAQGSCNPSATGGTSISSSQGAQSTTVQQPLQAAGGNPLIDMLGVLGPLVPLVKPGRKLMGHQVATADSTNMRQLRQLPAGLFSGNGPVIVAGCAGNSCNPSATGGTSLSTSTNTQSTSVQQPPHAAGGNPITDILGVLGPFVPLVAGGGRKLTADDHYSTNSRQLRQLPAGLPPGTIIAGCMGYSCNPKAHGGSSLSTSQTTQNTEIKQAPQESGGNPITDIFKGFEDIFGGRKLMGEQEEEQQGVPQAAAAAGGVRRLQCIERNLAECKAWGPSVCGLPGVNDKCPCMCGGLSIGAPTQGPQGHPGVPGNPSSITIINQETTAIGCKDGSCNPNAQGGNAGR